jgi:hypothetical protein
MRYSPAVVLFFNVFPMILHPLSSTEQGVPTANGLLARGVRMSPIIARTTQLSRLRDIYSLGDRYKAFMFILTHWITIR